MKRSPLTRKTPLKRGSWSRKSSPLPEGTKPARKTAIKARVKRPTVAEGSKYLEACRNEPCYLRIPGVCNGDWTTCVPAHRNEGKGMGLKVSNHLTLPACHACHVEYDQGKRFVREEKRGMWNDAYAEWEPVRARKMGLEQPELEEVV